MKNHYSILFPFERLSFSEMAVRLGVCNAIPTALAANASRLSMCLGVLDQRIYDRFGVRLNLVDAYRCPKVNAVMKGSSNSDHMLALAGDFTATGVKPLELAKFVREVCDQCDADFEQIILEFGAWVHFSLPQDGRKGKRECLTSIKRPNSHGELKTVYLAGIQEAS